MGSVSDALGPTLRYVAVKTNRVVDFLSFILENICSHLYALPNIGAFAPLLRLENHLYANMCCKTRKDSLVLRSVISLNSAVFGNVMDSFP